MEFFLVFDVIHDFLTHKNRAITASMERAYSPLPFFPSRSPGALPQADMVRAFGADPSATSRCATDGCYPVRERDGKQ
jgi:hypothetical protein